MVFLTIEELKGFYIGNKIIYDTSDGILRKALTNKLYKEDSYNNLYRQQVNRLALCIYHEGEIKFTLVGKTIKDILLKSYKFDPRNDYQLKVKIEIKDTPSVGQPLPSFDKCEVIEKEWNKPNIDINSEKEWFEWIRKNQPFYIEDYYEKLNVFNNIDILKKEGLSDYIYEIIAENRENKINKVLTQQ